MLDFKKDKNTNRYVLKSSKALTRYGNVVEEIIEDLSHTHMRVSGKIETKVNKLKKLYSQLKEGKPTKKEVEYIKENLDGLIKGLGYNKLMIFPHKREKARAKKRGENLEGFVHDMAAAILALAGVFFILAPESPTVTGLTVLNLTNPATTSLSMAFGVVLVATSVFLLLRKK